MITLRKRRPRLVKTTLWPVPYRQDNKNFFFRVVIGGRKLRFRAQKNTGKITLSENDFAKLFGFKKMVEMEAFIQKKGGAS